MPLIDIWPSLADEVELCDALFGGHDLVASWLDGEMARVTDPDFARSFSDHIDLPGVQPDDYLHRIVRTSRGSLLGGIRFYGRDITRPFVEIVAHSFDDIGRLCESVGHEWAMFAPPLLRLRTRPGRLQGLNLRGPNMVLDHSTYVGRCGELRPPVPHVWLEPFARAEDAQALVRSRYEELASEDPALARNISAAAADDLLDWHASGQLWAVRTPDAMVGLFAVAPGRIGWIAGAEINEEVIAVDHRGHGYAARAQSAWAAHTDADQLLIGTINRLNGPSHTSAQRAGRRRVLDAVFVTLDYTVN